MRRNNRVGVAVLALSMVGCLVWSAAAWAGSPIVITNEASEVKRANAVLNGIFLPSESESTTYYFEYGSQPCNTQAATCGVKTPARGPVTELTLAEPAKVTRLKPGTTYHYWLVATAAGGTEHGEEQTFTTASAEPNEYVFEKSLEVGYASGVAVNEANGDVYAADFSTSTIKQFNAEGVLQSSVAIPEGHALWQLAVDNSGIPGEEGDVYATDLEGGVVYKFAPVGAADPGDEGKLEPGTPSEIGKGVLSKPLGVAVDSAGDVYVASVGTGTVSEFSPGGVELNPSLITGLQSPRGLAVGADGSIYVAGQGSGTVEYTSTGVCAEPEGETCRRISAGADLGVALDSAGDVFVSEGEPGPAIIQEYGPGVGHPPIPNPVLERSGTFGFFPVGVAVSDTKLYAADFEGSVEVFRFLSAVPVAVRTEPAVWLGGSVGVLSGTVNPGGGEPAEYYFEYGTSRCDAVGETCGVVAVEPDQVPLDGKAAVSVSVRVDGLEPNTTYYYWIVGVNEESGVEHGEEQSFTTGPESQAPPVGEASPQETPVVGGSSGVFPGLGGVAPVAPAKPAVVVPRSLTRAQRLARALKVCAKSPRGRRRSACEKQARRRYGPRLKSRKASGGSGR